jgi:hypothetical protein
MFLEIKKEQLKKRLLDLDKEYRERFIEDFINYNNLTPSQAEYQAERKVRAIKKKIIKSFEKEIEKYNKDLLQGIN